mmetsp:Transcript_8748/g.32758  ORF Transcript_8748/g.32758 Transcript_8748/m.32758 type:complete len:247 (-) Transcript_8748:501-1241(-)
MPAGGMTNNSLVEPNRSTTTLVPTGLRARVAGLLGLTLKSPSDEVNASTGTARPWVKSVSTTVLVSTTFEGPVNTKSAASALWYRSSGDGSSKRVTTRSNRGSSIVTNPRKLIFSLCDGIVEGALPVNRNSNTAPAEYKSETGVTAPIICSGAAYPNVPIIVDPNANPFSSLTAAVIAASAVAPKSTRLTFPVVRSRSMFPGFTSRCNTGGRSEDRYCSVSKSCVAIASISNSVGRHPLSIKPCKL